MNQDNSNYSTTDYNHNNYYPHGYNNTANYSQDNTSTENSMYCRQDSPSSMSDMPMRKCSTIVPPNGNYMIRKHSMQKNEASMRKCSTIMPPNSEMRSMALNDGPMSQAQGMTMGQASQGVSMNQATTQGMPTPQTSQDLINPMMSHDMPMRKCSTVVNPQSEIMRKCSTVVVPNDLPMRKCSTVIPPMRKNSQIDVQRKNSVILNNIDVQRKNSMVLNSTSCDSTIRAPNSYNNQSNYANYNSTATYNNIQSSAYNTQSNISSSNSPNLKPVGSASQAGGIAGTVPAGGSMGSMHSNNVKPYGSQTHLQSCGQQQYSQNMTSPQPGMVAKRSDSMPDYSMNMQTGLGQSMGQATHNMGQANQGISQPNQNLGQPNHNIGQPNQNLVQPNQNPSQPNQNLAQPNQSMTQQHMQMNLSPHNQQSSHSPNMQANYSNDPNSQNSLYPNYVQSVDAMSMPPPTNLPARIQQSPKSFSPQQPRKSPQAVGMKQDSPYGQHVSPPTDSANFQNSSPNNISSMQRKVSVASKPAAMESTMVQQAPQLQQQAQLSTSIGSMDYRPMEDCSPPQINHSTSQSYRSEMNQNLMNNHNIPQEGYSPGQNHGYNYRANQLHIDVGNNGQGNFISPDPSAQPSYYPTNSGPRSDSYAHINDELCVPQQKKSCSVSPSNYFNHQYPSYHNMDSNRQDTMGRQDSMGRQDTMSNIRSEGLRQDTIRYDTFNEQPWRKSSLAPNMRLNSSHSPSSGGYMNYGQVKKSTNFNYNQYDQPVVRKTSFALFDDKKENRKDSLFPAKSYTNLTKPDKTRSQSLSAAEFLKREGNAKPLVKQNQSLWQHASKLRSAKNSIVGAAPTKHQLGLTYTPPPMLMPKRSGTGLYWSIRKNSERKVSTLVSSERKPSTLRRMGCDMNPLTEPTISSDENSIAHAQTPGTSAAAQPNGNMENGHELKERKKSSLRTTEEVDPLDSLDCNYPLDIEKARCTLTGRKPFTRPPMDNRANAPQRKNGLFLSGAIAATGGKGSQFAAELEALRKESGSSANSAPPSRKMSIFGNRKPSIVQEEPVYSVDEPTRKTSTSSDYYEYLAPESDVTPHINFGKNFQARVKKWASREVTEAELAAIPDRDEMVFDCKVIEHLPDKAVAAYEALACSHAIPRPGRNKELALHILMENQGNIQSAVMDLLRSDTLDWEQYPIIYNNSYTDTDGWTPEDISMFQDAIYKSEKDFHQVASELGNRTVKQCIAFYYTWKKACPDDYRKLRNLRRKRMLLEQQLDVSSFDARQRTQSENPHETSEDELSEAESDMTGISAFSRRSPPEKYPRLSSPDREKPEFALASTSDLAMPTLTKPEVSTNGFSSAPQSAYPWLHDEMFPSPASSSSVGNGYSQPPSVTNLDLFNNSSDSLPPMPPALHHKPRPNNTKKGAQPSADGFFHCRLCDKRFEKVKSLNAHMKSHAMKARAEAEAQQQFQQKQNSQNILQQGNINNGTPFNLAYEVARLQQQRMQQQQEEMNRPNEANGNSPMGLISPQQQQQQQLLRLMAAQNAFNAPDQVSAAMTQLGLNSAAAAAAAAMAVTQAQNPLGNVLLPGTQTSNASTNPLEQLHLQQNLQHSATIMP